MNIGSPHSEKGDVNLDSPHADRGGTVAGDDAIGGGSTVAGQGAQILQADRGSAVATGGGRASVRKSLPPEQRKRWLGAAIVFTLFLVLGFGLLIAGVTTPAIVALVVGGVATSIAIFRLAVGI